MNLRELTNLKESAERLRRKADQTEGALEQVKKQLVEEFNCDNVEYAEKLLKRLTKEGEVAKKDYRDAFDQFIEKWEGQLNS